MKASIAIALICVGVLSGCLMTTKRGEYALDVGKAEGRRAEVSGYLQASAFVEWSSTPYGYEPRTLVQLLIGSLLPGIEPTSYEVSSMRFTRGEGTNMLAWSAVVSGSEEVIEAIRSRVGKRIEGDFSFEEARLLQVRRERIYP